MPPKPHPPPVEVDPQLAEIEEWEELQQQLRQEAAARRAAADEVDPQLAEIEEWEEAALAATIEAFERQSLQELHKRPRVADLDSEEMHKRRCEEELRQEATARRAAADARKN
jgi:hypothetical protein